MIIKTETKTVKIALLEDGGCHDYFDSLEVDFPARYPDRDEADPSIILAPNSALTALVDYWEGACKAANDIRYCTQFLSDDELEAYAQSHGWDESPLRPLTGYKMSNDRIWNFLVEVIAPQIASRKQYDEVCHDLGFEPECGFVEITTRGTITFTCGHPEDIRALYAACLRRGYKPARSLIKAVARL